MLTRSLNLNTMTRVALPLALGFLMVACGGGGSKKEATTDGGKSVDLKAEDVPAFPAVDASEALNLEELSVGEYKLTQAKIYEGAESVEVLFAVNAKTPGELTDADLSQTRTKWNGSGLQLRVTSYEVPLKVQVSGTGGDFQNEKKLNFSASSDGSSSMKVEAPAGGSNLSVAASIFSPLSERNGKAYVGMMGRGILIRKPSQLLVYVQPASFGSSTRSLLVLTYTLP